MPQANAETKHFRIGHVGLSVKSDNPHLLDRIAKWMEDFEAADASGDGLKPDIDLEFHGFEAGQPLPLQIPEQAALTFENDSARYYRHGELWLVDFGLSGIVIVDRAACRMTGFAYTEPLTSSEWHFEDFMHPLYELMRQKGLYPHHAAAVSLDGCGLLLAGKSGQGKSSLTVDLVNDGFGFLSDDRCFVRETGGRFEAIGFYEPFKVFASNVSHLPDLSGVEQLPPAGGPKGSLDLRRHFPGQHQSSANLHGVLFPRWSPDEASRLEPLPPGQALLELMPLTMVCFDEASSRAHFEFAGRLAAGIPSARLHLGGDREHWHLLVTEFISRSRRYGWTS